MNDIKGVSNEHGSRNILGLGAQNYLFRVGLYARSMAVSPVPRIGTRLPDSCDRDLYSAEWNLASFWFRTLQHMFYARIAGIDGITCRPAQRARYLVVTISGAEERTPRFKYTVMIPDKGMRSVKYSKPCNYVNPKI